MAMAMPPRLMVLMVRPIQRVTSRVIRMESGMETSEMRVVRQFIRKIKSTRTTNRPPSSRDFLTFPIEASMKRDWRKISVLMWTSAGREEPISASSRSSLRVSSRELVLGCLVTVRRTAGLPSFEATPRMGVLAPILTSAMASSVTGRPLAVVLTTAFCSAQMSPVARTPRTIYSFPYW